MGHVPAAVKTELFARVDDLIDRRFSQLVKVRRHLHMHPELSWHEHQTTRFLSEQIHDLGLTFVPGPRGCGGTTEIENGIAPFHEKIAVRGDIDAIPVTEENDVEYCSRHEEAMHACGHDVHSTVLLGVCSVLKELCDRQLVPFPINVRAIFQPAEEVAEGAMEMIHHGVLKDVAAILAIHVDPKREVGHIGLKKDLQTACCDEINIQISGEGGHAARPHETADPIVATAQFINAAYSQIPRSFDVREQAVLSLCQIKGGRSSNVIPAKVSLHGTLRSFDESVRQTVLDTLRNLGKCIGEAFGVQIDVEPGVWIPAVNNSPQLVDLMHRAAESFLRPNAIELALPSMGGEDFACYQQKIDGALARLGCANGDLGSAHLHSPHFDVDEEVIRVACRLMLRAVLMWSSEHAEQGEGLQAKV